MQTIKTTKKLFNKGYTITVVSCENDGDYYQTNSITVDTIEEAKAWNELMEFCKPYQKKGLLPLGGSRKFSDIQINAIYKLFLKNKNHYKLDDSIIETLRTYNEIICDDEYVDGGEEDYRDEIKEDFNSVVFNLIGEPEDREYVCRYVKSCVIEYSPEDVFLTVEQITF